MPEFHYHINSKHQTVRLSQVDDHTYRLDLKDQSYLVSNPQWQQGELIFQLEGKQVRCAVAQADEQVWLNLSGETFRLTKSEARRARRHVSAGDAGQVRATMPGTVQAILVKVGEGVQQGDAVLILEAMKMEMRLTAPHAGVVQQILVQSGQLVEQGAVLVVLGEGDF